MSDSLGTPLVRQMAIIIASTGEIHVARKECSLSQLIILSLDYHMSQLIFSLFSVRTSLDRLRHGCCAALLNGRTGMNANRARPDRLPLDSQ